MATVFVVELAGHHRTAVFPLQPLHLGEYLTVKLRHRVKECRIFRPRLDALVEDPVRNTSVPDLAVAERSDAEYHRHSLFLTDFDESAEVPLSAPVKPAFILLDMVPEYVGGDNGHSPVFHLAYGRAPFVFRQAAIMDFPHHGSHSVSVDDEALRIPFHIGNAVFIEFKGMSRYATD